MGWWPTGEGDDVMGDDPADAFGSALLETARARGGETQLPEVLGALQAALRERHGNRLDVTAHDVTGEPVAAGRPGADLQAVFTDALAEIAASYRAEWQRDPRMGEIAATAGFVLGAPPPGTVRAPRRLARVSLERCSSC